MTYAPTENGIRNRYLWWEMSPERQKVRGERNAVEIIKEFDTWIRALKAEVFTEGYDYATNGKWGNLEPGENPYGDL